MLEEDMNHSWLSGAAIRLKNLHRFLAAGTSRLPSLSDSESKVMVDIPSARRLFEVIETMFDFFLILSLLLESS